MGEFLYTNEDFIKELTVPYHITNPMLTNDISNVDDLRFLHLRPWLHKILQHWLLYWRRNGPYQDQWCHSSQCTEIQSSMFCEKAVPVKEKINTTLFQRHVEILSNTEFSLHHCFPYAVWCKFPGQGQVWCHGLVANGS